MILYKYISFENDDGELIENKLLPTDIPRESIHSISPWFNDYGALFKNVTLLTDKYGNTHKVRGNWKELLNEIRNDNKKIGY